MWKLLQEAGKWEGGLIQEEGRGDKELDYKYLEGKEHQ